MIAFDIPVAFGEIISFCPFVDVSGSLFAAMNFIFTAFVLSQFWKKKINWKTQLSSFLSMRILDKSVLAETFIADVLLAKENFSVAKFSIQLDICFDNFRLLWNFNWKIDSWAESSSLVGNSFNFGNELELLHRCQQFKQFVLAWNFQRRLIGRTLENYVRLLCSRFLKRISKQLSEILIC